MRGIETAFWGVLGKDPELKTSKSGKPYATLNIVVTVGQTDSGMDESQWLRVTCFGEAAEAISIKAKKGDSVYCEGQLTLSSWTDKATGQEKHGLNVAAWRAERMSNIGKAKTRKPKDNGKAPVKAHAKPEYPFNDELSF